jgi:hypothetical protein
MPSYNQMVCDRCGGTAKLQLFTHPSPDYPEAQVFLCECGRVIWKKREAQQQQQTAASAPPLLLHFGSAELAFGIERFQLSRFNVRAPPRWQEYPASRKSRTRRSAMRCRSSNS